LAAVLSTKFNLLYTEGNLNNHIGVPLTLLRLNYEHEMAVIEMGASHPGDIKELVEIVNPNYGIITNAGCAHLEGFGSLENVVKTKGELYDYIRRIRGKIFIKKEDEVLQSIAKGIEQVTYGYGESSFTSGQIIKNDPYLTFDWKQQGKMHTVDTHLIGEYNIDNVLAAIAAGRYFKIPAERISRAIAGYEPSNNRSQLIKTENNILIVDAYNANPVSMKVALDNFASLSETPKAVILGDMFELGSESEALHAGVLAQIKAISFEKVLLCGRNFSKITKDYPVFNTTQELMTELKDHPVKGYHILIKGSRSMELEKTIELL
jgi:UDP-N-acetylmuramoyl-tripeptide--D-alanyl-D-alanine ligase